MEKLRKIVWKGIAIWDNTKNDNRKIEEMMSMLGGTDPFKFINTKGDYSIYIGLQWNSGTFKEYISGKSYGSFERDKIYSWIEFCELLKEDKNLLKVANDMATSCERAIRKGEEGKDLEEFLSELKFEIIKINNFKLIENENRDK